jgi:hypothetical protein
METQCPRMLGEMRELSMLPLSTIAILIFRSAEVEEANGSKEKGGEEGEEEIPIRSLYLHRALNLYDGMNRLFRDNWQ